MKAIVFNRYGSPDVLRLEDVPKPSPREGQVLVKVFAASANPADWHILRADPFLVRLMFGLRKPNFHILGADIAGRVEAVGSGAKQFRPGDEVFGDLAGSGFGGFGEYVCVPEDAVVLKPANLTFEEAAAVPLAAGTALQSLRNEGELQPGNTLLVVGASGGVGTFAVQIAKVLGADVTAVCSAANVDLVRSLGADRVIDYGREDVTARSERYDRILVLAGSRSLFAYRRLLRPGGIYVLSGGETSQFYQAMLLAGVVSKMGDRKTRLGVAKPNRGDLLFLKGLIEAGKVKPVIDRRYPLREVPDAIRYLETRRARGKVVITL